MMKDESIKAEKAKRASFDARCSQKIIGAKGFEPSTSRSRTERSTRLSHAPKSESRLPKNEGAS